MLIKIGLSNKWKQGRKRTLNEQSIQILQTLATFVIMISKKKSFCPKKEYTQKAIRKHNY